MKAWFRELRQQISVVKLESPPILSVVLGKSLNPLNPSSSSKKEG